MGTYYRYVNRERKEFVDLHDAINCGHKEGAAYRAGAILVYLSMPYERPPTWFGKWGKNGEVSTDATDDWYHEEFHLGYKNITKEVVEDMNREIKFFSSLMPG